MINLDETSTSAWLQSNVAHTYTNAGTGQVLLLMLFAMICDVLFGILNSDVRGQASVHSAMKIRVLHGIFGSLIGSHHPRPA